MTPSLSKGRGLTIKEIKIEGNTILTEEIDKLLDTYKQQEIERHKLQELTTAITNLYVEQGYLTSGAFIPKQEVIDGVVIIRIVEGSLEDLEIEGIKRLKESYILSQFKKVTQSVFNQNELIEALESLQADPLVEKVEAKVVKGTSTDKSLLLLDIEEAHLISASLEFNNHASPTIGEFRGVVTLAHNNLLGLRDRAFAQLDLSDGFTAYELNYTLPLNYQGTAISIGYRNGDSGIVEEPLDELDIRADAETLSFQLTQELDRSVTTQSSVSLILELGKSKTFLFKTKPFSFADGPQDGRSKLSVFRLQGDWLKRSDTDILSLRSRLSLGVDLFSATINEDAPDGLFLSWLGQAQYAVVVDKELNILIIPREARS